MVKRTAPKSQISTQNPAASAIKPPKFKEPNEKATPLGYASSVLNGDTVEGGLRSLTYKSIFASKLVDNLSTVRSCIVGEEADLSRISEKDWIKEETINRLREEVAEFKNRKDTRNQDNDEKISSFNLRLDDELNQRKEVTPQYSDELKSFYTMLYPDMNISFNNESYRISRKVSLPVDVKRMEDVQGFDGSIYAAKAEERRREEENERRKEQEQRELEQRANDAAMDVDAHEQPLDDFSEAYVDELPPDLSTSLGGDLPPDVAMDIPLGNDGFNNVPLNMNASASPHYDQNTGYTQSPGYSSNPSYTGSTNYNDPSMGPTY
ncbi:hypothetical protein FT663_00528 [Candidozyma haemuli var. vulneris]|uniref:Uncharacterized protein n=1 Tax=Candidozyma haemuli TaxID=45357 RepID=A0A2V1B164_9ASCO|nr:hypothetical protein CXQ85_004002 [[Candida] haemuloni]KAF3993254.1 hypothetical protein FT662_00634 [[Candida] haemuloni var. vulneris]KAF3995310.1 hypothetical protein FT663_00528 [[Candida] haemuloni var. vulneris]PVH23709.1 hypothetical protein CXQ85_004002 [[Candida] haemuloni]